MQGDLLTPDIAGYETACRLANLRYDRHPAVIARARTGHDVAAAYTLKQPSDAALDDLFATAQERPSALTFINVHQFHGAATRVAPDATALALREPHFAIVNIGMWLERTGEAETTWTANAKARMAQHASSGLYVNFLGDEGEGAIRASYRNNYDRLAAIKAAYDPDNIFHRSQNIKPASGG